MSRETRSFAFNVTVPNLLMMLLGILLRHWRLMDDRFVDGATRPVFNLALPCLLFFSIATNHPQLLGNPPLVLFGAVGTLATFLLLELAAKWLVKEPRERGCSCRAVSAPIPPSSARLRHDRLRQRRHCASLAVPDGDGDPVQRAVGHHPHAQPAGRAGQENQPPVLLRSIVTNPLIIGPVCGLLYAQTGLGIPTVIRQTGSYISALSLPLALLCTGASFSRHVPLVQRGGAVVGGQAVSGAVPDDAGRLAVRVSGAALGIIFLFSATPTASGSYVMTRAMGGNATLAATLLPSPPSVRSLPPRWGSISCAHGARFNPESLWKRTVRTAVRP